MAGVNVLIDWPELLPVIVISMLMVSIGFVDVDGIAHWVASEKVSVAK